MREMKEGAHRSDGLILRRRRREEGGKKMARQGYIVRPSGPWDSYPFGL
jgi:hypothetical protein